MNTEKIFYTTSLWECPKHGEFSFVGLIITTPEKDYKFCHICWAEFMVKGGVNKLTAVDSSKNSEHETK